MSTAVVIIDSMYCRMYHMFSTIEALH